MGEDVTGTHLPKMYHTKHKNARRYIALKCRFKLTKFAMKNNLYKVLFRCNEHYGGFLMENLRANGI